jgi:hypothetical protein
MQLPKFSVITVSFNQGEFIRDTIESVLAQDYPNFEHFVIDGGSTDNTVSILKEYPHLQWVSEPDRGQSHALNKGFSRATGDVIAWINSDDWYAPGAFHAIAQEITEYPVVMGRCAFVDKYGVLKEDVANVERNWFDTLKYWVHHSSPAQPSIFFARSIFEELRIPCESALDEGLHFTMDFDFWLRIQERYPLMRRIDKTLSYFRIYETNKTGADMASTYREFSRVYRRHSSRAIGQEQAFSFVVPVDNSCAGIEPFIHSVASSIASSVECVIVDRAPDRAQSRNVMKEVLQLGAKYEGIAFQHARVPEERLRTKRSAIDVGISVARSPLVAYVEPTRELPNEFVLRAQKIFNQDTIAFLFTSLDHETKNRLFSLSGGITMFNPLGPLGCRVGEPEFVLRKIAVQDVKGFQLSDVIGDADDFSLKRLLLMLTHKAWVVRTQDLLPPKAFSDTSLSSEAFRLYCNALLVKELVHELDESAFARLRAERGFALSIPEPLRQVALGVLSKVPKRFRLTGTEYVENELSRIALEHPAFGPASYLMSHILERQGRAEDARVWQAKWNSAHAEEQRSPLYSA